MATIKEQLKSNIDIHLDFRRGSLVDQSGNGNDGTFTGSSQRWVNTDNGLALQWEPDAQDYVSVSDASALQTSDNFSIVVWLREDNDDTAFNARIINKYEDADNYYALATGGPVATRFNATVRRSGTTYVKDLANEPATGEWVHFVLTFDASDSGNEIKCYKDGIEDTGTGITLIASNTTNDLILGRLGTSGENWNGSMREFIKFNTTLTAAQVGQLYQESLEEAGSVVQQTRILPPNIIPNPEFENDSEWALGSGWTISGGNANSDGSQSAAANITQSDILTVGKYYTVEFDIRNVSAGNIKPQFGATSGTNVSSDGVYRQYAQCTTSTSFTLQADADFVGEVHAVRVYEGSLLMVRAKFDNVPISPGTITEGNIEDVVVQSGSVSVAEDSDGKYLTSSSGGAIYLPSKDAYGTWYFKYKHAGSITSQFSLISDGFGEQGGGFGGEGYFFSLGSSENLSFGRLNASGGTSTLCLTSASAFSINTLYEFKITRTADGEFTFYYRLASGGDWTLIDFDTAGSNPRTDTTYSSSNTLVITIGASNKYYDIRHYIGEPDL